MQGATAGLFLFAVLVVFAIIVVAKSVTLIPQAEAAVIERLGRYSRTISGQLTLLIPFIDRVRARVDLRERVVSFPPQPVITEDNLTLNIDTVVYFQVTVPQAAVYEISNYIVGVEQLTTTTLRNVVAAARTVPKDARLVFTAHSVPVATDDRLGPKLYSRQVRYAAGLVAAAAGYADYDLAWQSRSGPPQVPWLEPDVADHLAALTEAGIRSVIVCPIGFVADHIEVVWDLDTELREQADAAGIALARAGTPNADPRFARLAVDLIDELRCGRAPARVIGPDPVRGCAAGINGEPCRPPHCVAEF